MKSENLVPTADEINVIMSEVGINMTVKKFKRLGSFEDKRARAITLHVTLQSEDEVRMMLARAREEEKPLLRWRIPPSISYKRQRLEKNFGLSEA